MLKLEDLLYTEPEQSSIQETTATAGRVTRKKNITGSYVTLLGKKGQEDYVQKTNIATELIALLEPEFSLDWKGHEIHRKGSYHGP